MKILYVASGIPVPGTLGGSIHVLEVARGLARRGHTVDVIARSPAGAVEIASLVRPASSRFGNMRLHHINVPKALSLLAAPVMMRLVRALQPDVIMERYYNFAGAGILAARRFGIPSILEVNALIVDPPAVLKRRLDDALGGPMRRWATAQCRMADRIVTPLHTTVPPDIPRTHIVELHWGANVEHFRIDRQSIGVVHTQPTVVFLGSFRAWHGVLDAVRAGGALVGQGRDCRFLFIGDGPQRAAAEQLAARWRARFIFTGAVPYDEVPVLLAQASVAVAPFNTAAHPALRAAGFFWSPLKVFEYMAAALPVVTIDIPPLNQIVRHGVEGLLYPEGDTGALTAAIAYLLDHPAEARAMGERGRERVMAHFSWARHCEELERVMREIAGRVTR
ncbi:MAG: glycosyltransferase family 4 protein [Roseiflexus sp.]|nr:glycosyltransferase family 4 protein [Roseiflexus sp.]MCS7288353.1 glycosyltransferase family 4 protein [Roseiflexus sp.]MDW8231218.1 glycosyltransferase family 4 protein [Roseiflexaceae bacterium]